MQFSSFTFAFVSSCSIIISDSFLNYLKWMKIEYLIMYYIFIFTSRLQAKYELLLLLSIDMSKQEDWVYKILNKNIKNNFSKIKVFLNY